MLHAARLLHFISDDQDVLRQIERGYGTSFTDNRDNRLLGGFLDQAPDQDGQAPLPSSPTAEGAGLLDFSALDVGAAEDVRPRESPMGREIAIRHGVGRYVDWGSNLW